MQRRKQSPSKRVGKIPVTLNRHTHEHMLNFTFLTISFFFLLLQSLSTKSLEISLCCKVTNIATSSYPWREAPGLWALGVVGCPYYVDVTQNLKHSETHVEKKQESEGIRYKELNLKKTLHKNLPVLWQKRVLCCLS